MHLYTLETIEFNPDFNSGNVGWIFTNATKLKGAQQIAIYRKYFSLTSLFVGFYDDSQECVIPICRKFFNSSEWHPYAMQHHTRSLDF